ncbi:MAG: lytic polysaccharide monooxygenase, partial [Planctomycetota bacterium]
RTDPAMGNTYLGLDQVSPDWPTTTIQGGETLAVDFFATAPHNPSVWDVWMTTPSWEPTSPLTWSEMEFLERPEPIQIDNFYYFDVDIPADRSGHHVLWIAWQRDDPVGEVFFSTSDVFVNPATLIGDFDGNGAWDCADLDLLSEAIVNGNHDPSFDLNGDQLVTADDVLDPTDGWLTVAGASPASPTQGNPYLPGDANLDGNVDGQDFVAWNLHKFSATTGWCQGDFNLDGLVDGSDFLVWNERKFTTATAVPEPRGAWLGMLVLVSLVGSLRTGTTRQQGSPA